MSDNLLPAELQLQIEQEANAIFERMKEASENEWDVKYAEGYAEGWHDGTAETTTRAQVLLDALEQFISYHETGLLPARHVYEKAVAARKQWKEGKEVGNG